MVTSLYDFYGFKGRGSRTVDELEAAIASNISQSNRFIPYIQKYEFEALVISGPQELSKEMECVRKEDVRKQAAIQKILDDYKGAENINDGYHTCPSRRIKLLFPAYDKKLHGPIICEKIGIETISQACPRFKNWIKKIECFELTVSF